MNCAPPPELLISNYSLLIAFQKEGKEIMSRILTAEHIRKSFGKNTVLKDINLSVDKGLSLIHI